MKCDYCGRDDCRKCTRQVHHHVMQMISDAEQASLRAADGVDETGIITQRMRIWWGLRDSLNDYFNQMTTEPEEVG